jgi:UPF0716 protein FxsA
MIILLLIIGIPVLEIAVMINIGQELGALNTVFLIILTALIGLYFAKIQGLNTIKSCFTNLYQNKMPVYEMASGAFIAIAAAMLIFPGFITDTSGFALLLPLTRNIIIKRLIKNKKNINEKDEIIDGEVIEREKDKDGL